MLCPLLAPTSKTRRGRPSWERSCARSASSRLGLCVAEPSTPSAGPVVPNLSGYDQVHASTTEPSEMSDRAV
eukprot:1056004-Prymnesium_polylepis.1